MDQRRSATTPLPRSLSLSLHLNHLACVQASVWPQETGTTPLEEPLQRMVQGGTALSRLMAADVVRFWVVPTEPSLSSPLAEWRAFTQAPTPASSAALSNALQLMHSLMEAVETPPYAELTVKLTAMHAKAVRR
jgi:hypothetical protein